MTTGHDVVTHTQLPDDEGNPTAIIEFRFNQAEFADEFRKAMGDASESTSA